MYTPKDLVKDITSHMEEYQVFQYPYETACVKFDTEDESILNTFEYANNPNLELDISKLETLLARMSGCCSGDTVYKIMNLKRWSNPIYVEFYSCVCWISNKIEIFKGD